jgi:hypothetical protein
MSALENQVSALPTDNNTNLWNSTAPLTSITASARATPPAQVMYSSKYTISSVFPLPSSSHNIRYLRQ